MSSAQDLANLDTRSKIGDSVFVAINASGGAETRLDLTALCGTGDGYPAIIELEAEGAECHVYQGDSTVVLPTVAGVVRRKRIPRDGLRTITVDSAADAYVACVGTGTDTGYLVATRVDKI